MTVQFNTQAALDQLTALGYKPGDTVRLRAFLPTKGTDKGRSCSFTMPNIPAAQVQRWEGEGRGVYFVVNPGGEKDKDIAQGIALFYEHDHLSKEASASLWESLGLPTPTLQVDTGGKSVHSYWKLDQPLPPKEWKALQSDLLEFSDGDRKIKNPSRVMRLAGAIHAETKQPAKIISNSGEGYFTATLRSIIPVATPSEVDRPITWAEFDKNTHLPVAESVPLEVVISRKHRDAIAQGAGEGSRNATGYSLACDLIGAGNYLASIGQKFNGDPYSLFISYCQACPADDFPKSEWEAIWKSATGDNPGPTLPPDSIEMCIKGWLWREGQLSTAQSTISQRPVDTGKPLQDKGLSRSVNVSTENGETEKTSLITDREWGQFAKAIASPGSFDPFQWLPERLAKMARTDAARNCIDPIAIWAYLLPSTLSMMGNDAWIDMAGWRVPNIIWSLLVAPSGTGKSRAERLVVGPIKKWNLEEHARWKTRKAEWVFQQKSKAKAKGGAADEPDTEAPSPRRYVIQQSTPEGIVRRLAGQENNGVLACRDEFAGFINGLTQYTAGKGDGMEMMLETWDGGSILVDRANEDDSFAVESSRLSLVGGIQPGVFERTFDTSSDSQGILARFLCVVPQELHYKRYKGPAVLPAELSKLYHHIDSINWDTITPTPEADDLFTEIAEDFNNQTAPTANAQPWVRKLAGQTLRLAMAIHAIECYYSEGKDPHTLTADTLGRAYHMAKHYQAHFYHLLGVSASEGLGGILATIQELACECGEGITARDVARGKGARYIQEQARLEGMKPADFCLQLFEELAEKGFGQLVSETYNNGRKRLIYKAFSEKCMKSVDIVDTSPKTHTEQGFETVNSTVNVIDQAVDNCPETHTPQGSQEKQSFVDNSQGNVNMNSYMPPGNISPADLEALGLEDF